MRSNFRSLYTDIFWFGVLAGSVAAFLAIYATRQGASSFQISLLTAGPAVMNLVFSLPAGRWLEGQSLTRTAFVASLWQRAGFLLLVPLPWLFAPQQEIWVIILITLCMSIPATVLAVSFNAMFADVVPAQYRGQVVARRNALLALSLSGTSLVCGQLLDRLPFPVNYQIVFMLGATGALFSSLALGRIRASGAAEPTRLEAPAGDQANPPAARRVSGARTFTRLRTLARSGGSRLLRLDLLRGSFGKFLAAYFLFYTFQYVPLPLFPLFNVRVLGLTDGEISLGAAVFHLVNMLISLGLSTSRIRLSYRGQLALGGILFSFYPLLLYLAQDARLYWAASLTGGLVWALLNAGLVNRLMERAPESDRPAHMTLHNLALNLGILIGSLVGPLLLGWFDLRTSLLISFGLRLLAGVFLAVWG